MVARTRKPSDPIEERPPVDTTNEFVVTTGENLPNHTTSLAGRSKFVRPGQPIPTCRTKQQAYRLAAYMVSLAVTLPDEDGEHTFEEVLEAVRNA